MELIEEKLTNEIIGAAIEVHREIGPGLLEKPYDLCLAWELKLRGFKVERQLLMPLFYKGLHVDEAYRLDLLVEDKIIVEIKAINKTLEVHEAQLLTYLRLSQKKVGLLMNFHEPLMKDGIKRMVL